MSAAIRLSAAFAAHFMGLVEEEAAGRLQLLAAAAAARAAYLPAALAGGRLGWSETRGSWCDSWYGRGTGHPMGGLEAESKLVAEVVRLRARRRIRSLTTSATRL